MMNKKRIFLTIFILIIGIFILNLTGSEQEHEDKINKEIYENLEKEERTQVIIEVRDSSLKDKKFLNIQLNNYEKIKEDIKKSINDNNIREYKNLISVSVSEEELRELEKNKNIEQIFVSPKIMAFLPDSAEIIGATKSWNIQVSGINITGKDETICVIDTGIDFSHPDLTGKNKTCIIDCFNKECIENCSLGDDNGHGTHVAGIIAAKGNIKGIAPNANLIGIRILDENGQGSVTSLFDLANAINWCVSNRILYNISVISMSLGTPEQLYTDYCDSYFINSWTKVINNATHHNISVIAATGNSGSGIQRNTTAISAPACIRNVIAVSATNKNDSIASYAHYNNITDFFAPGTQINSTWTGRIYRQSSGTSMATPHVAGAISLFRQFFKLQNSRVPTPQEIQNNLNSSGKKIETGDYNISRVDIYSAIEVIIKSVNVLFSSPKNNSYIGLGSQNKTFICNSTSDNYQLTNISFYLWNFNNNLIYKETKNISGTENSSIFNYNFSNDGIYLWNCIAYNNQSFSNSNSNFTIIYDSITTNISLVSSNLISSSGAVIDWTTYENANSSVNYGTTAELGSFSVNQEFTTTHSISIVGLSASTFYYYNVTSCDKAGNCVTNGVNNFTTSAEPQNIRGGGRSGSRERIIIGTNYNLNPEQMSPSLGVSREIAQNDKIKFYILNNGKKEIHHIIPIYISDNFIRLIINSTPIIAEFNIGETKKFDLTTDNYYDLMIRLNSITNKKANLTINTINEEIIKEINNATITTFNLNDNETIKTFNLSDVGRKNESPKRYFIVDFKIIIIICLAIIIMVLSIVFYLVRIRNKKKKISKKFITSFKKNNTKRKHH